MDKITDEDKERLELLKYVSKKGLKELNLEQLKRLEELVQKKDYSHNKKAKRSKNKLLGQINSAIYKLEEGSMI